MAEKRCFRCNGARKVFKMGSGYTVVNTGGVEVTCPLCNGEGTISMPDANAHEDSQLVEKQKRGRKPAVQNIIDSFSAEGIN